MSGALKFAVFHEYLAVLKVRETHNNYFPERGERAVPLHDFFYVICDLFIDHRFPELRLGPYLDGLSTCISPYCVIIWHHTMPFLFIQEDPCAPSAL